MSKNVNLHIYTKFEISNFNIFTKFNTRSQSGVYLRNMRYDKGIELF